MNRTYLSMLGTGLLACALVTGCGKAADKVNDDVNKTAQQTAAADQWQSACTNVVFDLFGLSSMVESIDLGASYSKNTTFFGENNCATPVVSVVENGNYTIGSATPTESYLFDVRVDSVAITALTDGGRDSLNLIQFCGVNDWQTGQPRDVTVATQNDSIVKPPCWTKSPRNIADIIKVDGDQMRLGLVKDGLDRTAPDKRPLELDQARVFNRK